MNQTICIDASVAVKWVVAEDHSPLAIQLLEDAIGLGTRIVAPPHMGSEVANAIYKRLRTGEMDAAEAAQRAARFSDVSVELVNPPGLLRRAITIAADLHWKTPYDALYLAAAELLDCPVWTADATFYRAGRRLYPQTHRIADYRSP